jgi:hypothetical protein
MSASTPLELLVSEFLPSVAQEIEAQVATIEELPAVQLLGDLKTPDYGHDETELIAHRFLYRGGVMLLLGPTGVGKSAMNMQMGIHFAVGRGVFGIEPGACYRGAGMRVLLVQAENDEGDLAEMRDGVLAGCEDLTPEEKARALKQMVVCTICDRSSERFVEALEALLEQHGPYEIVILDPAFAYLGGDSNSQKDVSFFMRELLNPLLQKHRVGLILAHHTNKPMKGKEKEHWEAGDYAYLGAGSAEWINPARAALAIRSVGSDRVFELRAPKRGRRLGWKDADGQPTSVRYIAHHDEPGVICWREATAGEIEEVRSKDKGGRPKKCEMTEVLHCISTRKKRNQAYYKGRASSVLGCSETAVQNAINAAIDGGYVRFKESGREKLYFLTAKGEQKVKEMPSTRDWLDHKPESSAE